jgi:hypothetical protein
MLYEFPMRPARLVELAELFGRMLVFNEDAALI